MPQPRKWLAPQLKTGRPVRLSLPVSGRKPARCRSCLAPARWQSPGLRPVGDAPAPPPRTLEHGAVLDVADGRGVHDVAHHEALDGLVLRRLRGAVDASLSPRVRAVQQRRELRAAVGPAATYGPPGRPCRRGSVLRGPLELLCAPRNSQAAWRTAISGRRLLRVQSAPWGPSRQRPRSAHGSPRIEIRAGRASGSGEALPALRVLLAAQLRELAPQPHKPLRTARQPVLCPPRGLPPCRPA